MVFLIKTSVNRIPGMVNKAKGLKGVIFMDYPALIFLGGWQLGIPSRSGALDTVGKVRDTSELVS